MKADFSQDEQRKRNRRFFTNPCVTFSGLKGSGKGHPASQLQAKRPEMKF